MNWEEFFRSGAKELCIYCRGAYAVRTYLKLRDLGIQAGCIGDGDRSKQGYFLDNIYCISYEEILKKDKENTVILVCKEHPEDLIGEFREAGFRHAYSYKLVEQIPQSRPTVTLDTETLDAINLFREELYQIMHSCNKIVPPKLGENSFCASLTRMLQDALARKGVCDETNACG